MEVKPYYGWYNWDTWAVNLWLCNSEYEYYAAVKLAKVNDIDGLLVLAMQLIPLEEKVNWTNVNWNEIVDNLVTQ